MEKIKRKDGIKFRETIRINGRAVKSPVFNRKTDAIEWKARRITERQKNLSTGTTYQPTLKLSIFVNKWISSKVDVKNSIRTKEAYLCDLKNHILPMLGNKGIGHISEEIAGELIKSLKDKDLSNRTINKVLIVLKTILNDAVKWKYLPQSPIHSYPELKVQERADFFLSKMQIDQLLIASHGTDIEKLLITALNTGMRLGELLGLCWDRVNLNEGFLEVTRTLTRHGLSETTKTNSKRTIYFNPVLKELFKKMWLEQKTPQYVLVSANGKPFDINHIVQRDFKKVLLKAKLPSSVRFHDLRHTYASQFVMAGGKLEVLQKLLGHKTMDMTQRYAHLAKEVIREASNVVSFGNVLPENDVFSCNVAQILPTVKVSTV
jgi:integrase